MHDINLNKFKKFLKNVKIKQIQCKKYNIKHKNKINLTLFKNVNFNFNKINFINFAFLRKIISEKKYCML